MDKAPLIRDHMVKNPLTIDMFDTASAAEKIMNARKIHHLPVVDGKKVYGIVSDRDISVSRRAYKSGEFDGKVLVKDICLEDPLIVKETESLDYVASIMSKKRLDAVIIVRDNIPVGIFTSSDACKFIAEIFRPEGTGFWSGLLK
jgi:acetoin utilization protein AcuB